VTRCSVCVREWKELVKENRVCEIINRMRERRKMKRESVCALPEGQTVRVNTEKFQIACFENPEGILWFKWPKKQLGLNS